MVYESRPGETFVLGASTWRIEDITFQRVTVTPAPGEPGKMPFWHGDRPGRPLELGRALGAFVRELRELPPAEGAAQRCATSTPSTSWRRANLLQYVDEQAEATGVVPDDRTIVVERFRDEIGDWRVCVLSPFGTPVHAPWAMAIERRLADRYDMPVESMWGDDGIVLRLPEAADELPLEAIASTPRTSRSSSSSTLPQTALFSSRFRECAGRALLLPRRRPDQRTPLWQQRQRAADLLAVAAKYPTFPILLEASRECLQDVFDVPALREVLGQLRSRGRCASSPSTRRKPSPMAQSLLFNWIAAYMYEGDAPLAERRAAALALDRDLLRDLLGAEELRELLDPGVLADVELDLQRLSDGRRARSADELHDVLRRVGDLTAAEVDLRCEPADGESAGRARWLARAGRRAAGDRGRVAGEARFAAAEDAARYRDALGCALPLGLPAAFTDPVPRPLEELVARYARTHGPFVEREVADRFGMPESRVAGALAALEADGRVVRGEFRPEGVRREWCDIEVLRQLRRRSLAALRREVEPVEPEALARFLPAWHGRPAAQRRGVDAVVEALGVLAGAPIVASTLETDVLAARVADYRGGAARRAVHVGRRRVGRRRGDRLERRAGPAVLRRPARAAGAGLGAHDPPERRAARRRPRRCSPTRGASFWTQLRAGAVGPTDDELLAALWDLVWAGEVTNDSLAPLRAVTGAGAARRRPGGQPDAAAAGAPGRLGRIGPPAGAGRWSLVAPLLEPRPTATESAHATAMQLVERHGVVTREAVLAEGVVGGYASVYGVLKVLEERGQVRRGYFVSGLGAAQFALPGAVDRLRSSASGPTIRRSATPATRRSATPVVLAATDPAQPYGGHAAVAGVARAPGPHRRRAGGAARRRADGLVRPPFAPSRHVPRARSTTARGPRRSPTSCTTGGCAGSRCARSTASLSDVARSADE